MDPHLTGKMYCVELETCLHLQSVVSFNDTAISPQIMCFVLSPLIQMYAKQNASKRIFYKLIFYCWQIARTRHLGNFTKYSIYSQNCARETV